MRLSHAFFLLIFITACQYDNPNDQAVPPRGTYQALLNTAILQTALQSSDMARLSSFWVGQFGVAERTNTAGLLPPQGVSSDRFDEIWGNLYNLGYINAVDAEVLANTEADEVASGIAKIMQAYFVAETAMLFGDVPFTEAGDPINFPQPAYDPQEDVLNAAIDLLADGSAATTNRSITELNGVLVGTATWPQFASALTARYQLALGNYEEALLAAQSANLLTTDAEIRIPHQDMEGSQNLFYNFDQNQRRGVIHLEDSHLTNLLSSLSEESRADEKTVDTSRFFHFAKESQDYDYKLNTDPGGYFGAASSFVVMGVPEVQLIIAECAARLEQRQLAIDALNVARNYWDERLGVDDYQDYVDDDTAVAADQLLRTILTEKYLSTFGTTAFYDITRTDNFIGVPFEDNRVPQRFLYPQTELDQNENVPGPFGVFEPTPINF